INYSTPSLCVHILVRRPWACDELRRWLAKAPWGAHLVLVKTTVPSQRRTDGLVVTQGLISSFGGSLDRTSSLLNAANYLFPGDSPKKHDDNIEAVIVSVELHEDVEITEQYFFSSESKTDDYARMLERKFKETRKKIEDNEISDDKLKLDLEKILETTNVTQDGAQATFEYSISQNLVLDAIQSEAE
ncbi:MAG: hypothetical protein KY476_08935, partial [Planctomycetes bacterium]|nr:hypothetical protein [Planctomycetota bacterium]